MHNLFSGPPTERVLFVFFFFSSRRRHTRLQGDWSSDVCSSDLSGRYAELAMSHQMMLQEVVRVQKTVLNHEQVIQDVMTFLHAIDAKQRRDSRSEERRVGKEGRSRGAPDH